MKKMALALLATSACLLPSIPSATASAVTRTFSAHDITQCSCTYNTYHTVSYVNGWPNVTVTSYYDTTITAMTSPYTRGTDVNDYHAYNGSGSLAGKAIWTSTSETAYVLCWTTSLSGAYMDKVAAKLTVNDTYGWFISYIPDEFIHDYVTVSGHHC